MTLVLAGECPHHCTQCDAKFKTKRSLDTHVAHAHDTNAPLRRGGGACGYVCHVCTYTCSKKATFKRHVLSAHGEACLTDDLRVPCRVRRVVQLHELPPEQQTAVRETLALSETSTRHAPVADIMHKLSDKLQQVQSMHDIAQQPPASPDGAKTACPLGAAAATSSFTGSKKASPQKRTTCAVKRLHQAAPPRAPCDDGVYEATAAAAAAQSSDIKDMDSTPVKIETDVAVFICSR